MDGEAVAVVLTLAEDLAACPTVGDPPCRVVPEKLAQRIEAALREAEGFVTIPRLEGY